MKYLKRAIVVGSVTFGASVVGMLLQGLIPADVLTASKSTVGAMVGIVGLLLALVLGLLIWTAFAVFTTQQSEAFSLAPVIAEVDLALEQYGAQAAPGRAGFRASLHRSRARFFDNTGEGPQPFTFAQMKATFAGVDGFFESLKPATETEKRLLAKAWDGARKFQDTQMLMARQLANPFPPHVLNIVVAWATALFLGNGLVAATNAVTVVAHLAGAISIATAIFLILELSHPYNGFIRLSPEGLDLMIEALG